MKLLTIFKYTLITLTSIMLGAVLSLIFPYVLWGHLAASMGDRLFVASCAMTVLAIMTSAIMVYEMEITDYE